MKKLILRPEIPEQLAKAVQRYATAHSISTTAAVALLLSKILKQEKWIK